MKSMRLLLLVSCACAFGFVPQRSSRLLVKRSAEEPEVVEKDTEVDEKEEVVSKAFDIATLSSRQKVANQKAPAREFLSESWKEEVTSDDGNGGGLIAALASAVLAIIFISLAQVPEGNDLSSFSYDRSNKPMSPSEIASMYKSVSSD